MLSNLEVKRARITDATGDNSAIDRRSADEVCHPKLKRTDKLMCHF